MEIKDIQQDQMLKLITKSFYRELINYGITKANIVTISTHLLDFVIGSDKSVGNGSEYYDNELRIDNIKDNWNINNCLAYEEISLVPVKKDMYSKIIEWLRMPVIWNNLLAVFPCTESELGEYLEKDNNQYFAIFHKNDMEGIIGADNIDTISRKLEMKKFIGNFDSRGKGIGKRATFLFLYYVFSELNFNKVYIYTLNKNIANINLNSRFGFVLEGILYKDMMVKDKLQDIVRMGLLSSVWNELFDS